MPSKTTHGEVHILWLALLVSISLLYTAIVAANYHLPFLDLPNHAARAMITGKQVFFSESHPFFVFNWAFRPYILGDLALTALVSTFGFNVGSILAMVTALLLFPLSMWIYLSLREASLVQKRIASLLALFLATNWFFLSAYIHFVMGCSISLIALAFLERASTRPSVKNVSGYILLSLCAYLLHVASFMFLCVMGGFAVLWAAITSKRIAKLFWATPLILMGLHYLWLKRQGMSVLDVWIFRPLPEKIIAGGSLFYRFDLITDAILVMLFLGILLFCERSKQKSSKSLNYYLWMTGLLITTYFALPKAAALTISDIDTRALPFGFFFAICSATTLQMSSKRSKIAICLISALLLTNALYLHQHLKPQEQFLSQYSNLLEALPEKAIVLPVNTRRDFGRMQTSLHSTAEAAVFKNAFVPFILSSRAGEPVTYFHYKIIPALPSAFWYIRDEAIDWRTILPSFSHLVSTKPVDLARLPLEKLETVAENSSGILFRVVNTDTNLSQTK